MYSSCMCHCVLGGRLFFGQIREFQYPEHFIWFQDKPKKKTPFSLRVLQKKLIKFLIPIPASWHPRIYKP